MTLDMQEARAAYEKIQHKAHICTDYDVFAASMYLPVALDEIDRMQSQIEADVRQQAEQAVSLDAAESLVRRNAETINGMQQEIERLRIENINLKSSLDQDMLSRQVISDGEYIKELKKKIDDNTIISNYLRTERTAASHFSDLSELPTRQ